MAIYVCIYIYLGALVYTISENVYILMKDKWTSRILLDNRLDNRSI